MRDIVSRCFTQAIGRSELQPRDDTVLLCSYSGECKAIAFKDFCCAVAKQLVEDGVIPGGE